MAFTVNAVVKRVLLELCTCGYVGHLGLSITRSREIVASPPYFDITNAGKSL